MQSNVHMSIGNGMFGGNVDIIAILKLMKEGHITRTPAVTLGQVVSESKTLKLFIGALDNDSHVVLFPVEENERLDILIKFVL
jgi:hypothetical protein